MKTFRNTLPRVAFSVVSALLAVVIGCSDSTEVDESADLVLSNGRLVTVDDTLAEAEALAVVGDRIVAVGTDEELRPYIGAETLVVDLEGRLAVPGFIESHAHFMWLGDALMQISLADARSWDEVVARIGEAAASARPGELIRGVGWHQEKWDQRPQPNVKGFPVHHDLSAVSPDNPVILTHASSHGVFANSKAMELAGVDADSPVPEGGEVVLDASSKPTGMFIEHAQDLLRELVPAGPSLSVLDVFPGESIARRRVELASEEALRKGVTTIHEAGTSFETVDFYRRLVDEGELPLRLWIMLSEDQDSLASLGPALSERRLIGYGDHRLTVRAIKRVLDGALGSRGAWLLEPYHDLPTSTGLNTEPLSRLEETARLALEHGFQLAIHAIGSRANREALNVVESVVGTDRGIDHRFRIEHAQHIHPEDVPRFGELGVIASMQTVHASSDAVFVPDRLGGMRAEAQSYLWKSLLDSGARLANGTDAPVEDIDPIPTFFAAVTRRVKDGTTFVQGESLTREQALHAHTMGGAYAGFEEDIKGSLSVGKLADIVVLSKDIMLVPVDEIPETRVEMTIVGGKIVYRRSPSAESE